METEKYWILAIVAAVLSLAVAVNHYHDRKFDVATVMAKNGESPMAIGCAMNTVASSQQTMCTVFLMKDSSEYPE